MEYQLPSQFDSNGFNMASPIVQNMGVGYQYPTPNTFRYNGDSPYQTQIQNQQNYNYYTTLGQQASQQLQYYQNPQYNQPQYGYYQNPYYYQQQPTNFDYTEMYRDMYINGDLSLADYCQFANSSMFNQPQQQINSPYYNEWYASAINLQQRRLEQQRLYQQQCQEQAAAWELARQCYRRYYGIDEPSREQVQQQEQYIDYMQRWDAYRRQKAQYDYEQNQIISFMSTLDTSDRKGYVSPFVQQIKDKWNKIWLERNGNLPKDYGIDEYFNGGILRDQILNDMEYEMKERQKKLNRLYDQRNLRNIIHSNHPDYDPITGASLLGAKRLDIGDIEVKLPPELSSTEYIARRNRFINSVLNPGVANYHTKI